MVLASSAHVDPDSRSSRSLAARDTRSRSRRRRRSSRGGAAAAGGHGARLAPRRAAAPRRSPGYTRPRTCARMRSRAAPTTRPRSSASRNQVASRPSSSRGGTGITGGLASETTTRARCRTRCTTTASSRARTCGTAPTHAIPGGLFGVLRRTDWLSAESGHALEWAALALGGGTRRR